MCTLALSGTPGHVQTLTSVSELLKKIAMSRSYEQGGCMNDKFVSD